MHQAKSYKEWSCKWGMVMAVARWKMEDLTSSQQAHAKELDKFLGNDEWTKIENSNEYDVPLIRKMARKLKRLRHSGVAAVREVRKVLAHGACKADVGGVQNPALYSVSWQRLSLIVRPLGRVYSPRAELAYLFWHKGYSRELC